MKKLAILCIAFIAAGSFASCSKYEDGPAISLKSRTERVSNTWQIESAWEGDENVTENYDQYELQMLNDGDASLVAIYSFGDFFYEYETNGTWEFEDSQEQLELDFENDDADRTYLILRLTEDELWLNDTEDNVELHLIPA